MSVPRMLFLDVLFLNGEIQTNGKEVAVLLIFALSVKILHHPHYILDTDTATVYGFIPFVDFIAVCNDEPLVSSIQIRPNRFVRIGILADVGNNIVKNSKEVLHIDRKSTRLNPVTDQSRMPSSA